MFPISFRPSILVLMLDKKFIEITDPSDVVRLWLVLNWRFQLQFPAHEQNYLNRRIKRQRIINHQESKLSEKELVLSMMVPPA